MYDYEFKNGHCILCIEGRNWLLDTGSPNTFAFDRSIREINIDGKDYVLNGNPGYTQSVVEQVTGCQIFGMIGNDILKKTSFTIFANGKFEFNVAESNEAPISISTINYVIIDNILLEGKMIKALFDTGAYINYLMPNKCSYNDLHRTFTDHDRFGKLIASNGVSTMIKAGELLCEVSFGIPVSNASLSMQAMMHCRVDAIIGLYNYHFDKPLFSEYLVVDYKNNKMYIK